MAYEVSFSTYNTGLGDGNAEKRRGFDVTITPFLQGLEIPWTRFTANYVALYAAGGRLQIHRVVPAEPRIQGKHRQADPLKKHSWCRSLA